MSDVAAITPLNTEYQLSEYDALRIARAVFFGALCEASSQSGYSSGAQMWLGSFHAENFAYAAGIDPEYLQRWLKVGCPRMKKQTRREMDLIAMLE